MRYSLDRRNFLRASTLSGATLALAPRNFVQDLEIGPAVKPQRAAWHKTQTKSCLTGSCRL